MSQNLELPENSRVVQPKYLEKHTSKKDLIRRLRNLVEVLRDEDCPVESESPEWPGLAAVSEVLVSKYLKKSDREVRLYAVLAIIEIFWIYAPEVPWDEAELMDIFRQITRQLGNLAHTTESNASFHHYVHILERMANVRIGCLLVDVATTQENTEAQEVLVEFIHTLLQSVRREHPAEILTIVQQAITVCLDEYNPEQGVPYPIPILDELLCCIGQGRTQWVIAPNQPQAAANHRRKKKQALAQIEVTNPTYVVAAAVIRSVLNKIATPMSLLLNGLLTGEQHVVDQSSIRCIPADVSSKESSDHDLYNIIFELHRVAPQILTTVIGTVAGGLRSTRKEQRLEVTKLLGRLFAVNDLAEQYAACFREWLGRHLDIDSDIRLCMVTQCMAILQAQAAKRAPGSPPVDPEIAVLTADALKEIVTADNSLDVRSAAIHEICEFAYRASTGSPVTATLLQAVGSRVSSKQKQERRDAVTGLAHIYFKQFVQPQLKSVVEGGDDCDLGVILKALHETCHLEAVSKSSHKKRRRHEETDWVDISEEQYGWIPTKVLECTYFSDQTDPEMRCRVVQIVDDILLGDKKKLTGSARAVGLTMMLDSLLSECGGVNSLLTEGGNRSNAFKFLQQLLGQRAALQKTLSSYIDARAKIRECEAGSEAALVADARAMEMLEMAAKRTAPPNGASIEDVLHSFHTARDKHIFRVLATIVSPAHTAQARARALEELPKRTKVLGDAVSDWVKNLVKRCAMGNSLNIEVVNHCVLLAQECFRESDIPASAALLACVKTAVDIFPALCGSAETFNTLTELFSECRSVSPGEFKKELKESGIVTVLSSILSVAAISQPGGEASDEEANKEELKSQLTQMCTRDGTPEQARNAVYTLARLLNPEGKSDFSSQDHEVEAFSPLLQTLTSASKLKISSDNKESLKVVSILSALSALADCAPRVFVSSARGEKALKFALEAILLGRDHSAEDSESDGDSNQGDEEEEPTSSSKKRRRSSSVERNKHSTPEAKASLLEDENLSPACRRVCAAVDFLVSHIRSSTLAHIGQKPNPKMDLPSPSQVELVFQLLTQMIHDQGLPPSNRDRKLCKTRQDRAALRQSAAIALLRLCDARLMLEKQHLSASMWHILGKAFLDEERVVREAVMEEFSLFLKSVGIYGPDGSKVPPKTPALRFVSLITLCCDGDHGSDNAFANGGAANVGKTVDSMKNAALQCIVNLRKVSDATYTQCCAVGKEAEKKFETTFKMLVMPEYMVPFAFHLLTHRRETPGEGGVAARDSTEDDDNDSMSDDDDSVSVVSDESQQKILRRRLKLLFYPLVHSLGDGADNISFLLEMALILGKHYKPVDVTRSLASHSPARLSIGSTSSSGSKPSPKVISKRNQMLEAKLKTVCTAAREVLLSFVKKDVNLTEYPGVIQLPSSLFKRTDVGTVRLSVQSVDSSARSKKSSKTRTVETPPSRQPPSLKQSPDKSPTIHLASSPKRSTEKASSRVHFSPDVEFKDSSKQKKLLSDASPESKDTFDALSPIAKSASPSPRRSPRSSTRCSETPGSGTSNRPRSSPRSSNTPGSSGGDTLGTTPPPGVATMTTQAPSDAGSPTELPMTQGAAGDNDFPTQESDQPSMRSTTQSSEPSQNDSSLNLSISSQLSHQSSKSSSCGRRRRRAGSLLKDKSQAKKSTVPSKVKVDAVQPKRKRAKPAASQEYDEFDFEAETGFENVENRTAKAKTAKGTKTKAGKGRAVRASSRRR